LTKVVTDDHLSLPLTCGNGMSHRRRVCNGIEQVKMLVVQCCRHRDSDVYLKSRIIRSKFLLLNCNASSWTDWMKTRCVSRSDRQG